MNKQGLDPIVKAFLDALAKKGGTPIYKLSPEDARKVLSDAQACTITTMPADIEDRTIQGKKSSINIRIVKPKGATGLLPIVIYLRGGGRSYFVMLNAITQSPPARAAIAQANQWLAHIFATKK